MSIVMVGPFVADTAKRMPKRGGIACDTWDAANVTSKALEGPDSHDGPATAVKEGDGVGGVMVVSSDTADWELSAQCQRAHTSCSAIGRFRHRIRTAAGCRPRRSTAVFAAGWAMPTREERRRFYGTDRARSCFDPCPPGDALRKFAMNRFATRLNSFAARADEEWPDLKGRPDPMMLATRAAKVDGLTHVDLNYPDHVADTPAKVKSRVDDIGLAVNGLAMRYYTNPAFKLGAFTHPDASVRREAIDLTKAGIDAALEMGAPLMTLWMGQDGFDYSFQCDYDRVWTHEVDGIREVAEHASECAVSIEYKPNEPRAFALMPDIGTTLLALDEVGAKNLGVTLDFAHVLYADEMPAFAAALVSRRSRLLGVHLNDGYAKRDDGLMVASVHPQATLELLWQIRRDGYGGVLYFDTFPDASGIDPVAECASNIATVRRLLDLVDRIDDSAALRSAIDAQDAPRGQRAIQGIMLGK